MFMTLANKITSVRFLLCIGYFALLEMIVRRPGDTLLLDAAFGLFLVIAFSDLLDGYLARRYGEVTLFGRIADPLVDKILVCGSLLYFLRIPPLPETFPAWFAVLVLTREFLVSGIRGAAESAGIPFGATFWGKHKTLIQNIAVGTGLCYAAHFQGTQWAKLLASGLMWLTLASTVVSGIAYAAAARRLLGKDRA